jgi:osmoprotectant transport system ATP-binding protein
VIQFESVGKTFKDGTAAVVDLNLTVPSGRITVIVGPSGCGKTTTLRMVNRMIEPTKGRILWDGKPLRSMRRTTLRRQMGYVIQNGGLLPHRTVLDNIQTVPGLLGWDKPKSRKRALELLDSVGLESKLAHRYPAQLSGGQQQRVGVARALAADPLVMLMDEPFSAVDPVVRAELHEFFLNLQHQLSKTIVLITHDIDEAIKLGDQVAILRVGGTLAQVGTPQELLEQPADAFVEGFVGKDRGYRSLSFTSAASLPLRKVKVVRDPSVIRSAEPALVVDGDARPLGWAELSRPGHVAPLGATFDPEKDTLRAALDAALTSPVGLAVAVSSQSKRYAGVVSARDILAQVTDARAALAGSTPFRDVADPGPDEDQHDAADTAPGAGTAETEEPLLLAGQPVVVPVAEDDHAEDWKTDEASGSDAPASDTSASCTHENDTHENDPRESDPHETDPHGTHPMERVNDEPGADPAADDEQESWRRNPSGSMAS